MMDKVDGFHKMIGRITISNKLYTQKKVLHLIVFSVLIEKCVGSNIYS